jgi:Cytochrome P450
MVLHPDAQRRAQMEIDKIVGTDRLPDFSDEMSLPYVSALIKEVLRWHPVAPIGTPYSPHFRRSENFCLISRTSAVPHRLVTDDVYEGYFLPAGSMVIGNTW